MALSPNDKKWLKSNFLTKVELTKNNKSLRKEIVTDVLEHLDKNFLTKAEHAEIKELISDLPTKDEFASANDKIMGELKKVREEHVVLTQHSKDHSDAIEKLQKIHPGNRHVFEN